MVRVDSRARLMIATTGLAALVALLALGSLGTGPVRLSPSTVVDALLGGGTDIPRSIVGEMPPPAPGPAAPPGGGPARRGFCGGEIRLPRMILGLAIGAILGLSGAALQGL